MTRVGARRFAAGVLLLANAYLLLMIYTFGFAPTATARVTHCTFGRTTNCDGTWTEDGRRTSGHIVGAGSEDRGHTLPVRLGPIWAWDDAGSTKWFHLGFPVFVDAVGIGSYLYVRRRLRPPSGRRGQ